MVKVNFTPRSNCQCLTSYRQVGVGPSTKEHSCVRIRKTHGMFLKSMLKYTNIKSFKSPTIPFTFMYLTDEPLHAVIDDLKALTTSVLDSDEEGDRTKRQDEDEEPN